MADTLGTTYGAIKRRKKLLEDPFGDKNKPVTPPPVAVAPPPPPPPPAQSESDRLWEEQLKKKWAREKVKR